MTMQHQIHPDDERLAALAGGDADATADAGLRAHVATCDRCGPMVAELGQLRSALAELPDLVPSRRIQLVPPVPTPTAEPSGGWLRRLAGPMVATGLGMVLVGAIGTSGVLSSFGALGSAAAPSAGDNALQYGCCTERPADASSTSDRGGVPVPESSGREVSGQSQVPAAFGSMGGETGGGASAGSKGSQATPTPQPAHVATDNFEPTPIDPWFVVLLAGGAVLIIGGLVLVTQPVRGP